MKKVMEDVSTRRLVKSSAFIVLLIGFHFLASRHLGISKFMKIPPESLPMPYISSICLFFSGISLFSVTKPGRILWTRVFGLFIFCLSLIRGIEIFFPKLFKINFFFFTSTPMSLTAAIGFLMVGLVFLFWTKTYKAGLKNAFLLLLSSLILFLGAVGFFIRLLSLDLDALHSIVLHFYAAIGLFFIGLSFLIVSFREITRNKPNAKNWLSFSHKQSSNNNDLLKKTYLPSKDEVFHPLSAAEKG